MMNCTVINENNKKMNKIMSVLAIAITMLFTACGSSEQKPAAEETAKKEDGAGFLADDGPAYDKTAIDANAPVTTLTIKGVGENMADMKYDLSELTVPAGSTVKLTLLSEATDPSMPHNWVLVKKGNAERIATKGIEAGADKAYVDATDTDVLVYTKMVGPGEKDEITFPAPPPGEYQYICTYPGHWQKMQGILIVK
jgi:azurin